MRSGLRPTQYQLMLFFKNAKKEIAREVLQEFRGLQIAPPRHHQGESCYWISKATYRSRPSRST
jgi:hypothetical protein